MGHRKKVRKGHRLVTTNLNRQGREPLQQLQDKSVHTGAGMSGNASASQPKHIMQCS